MRGGAASLFGAPTMIFLALLACLAAGDVAAQAPTGAPDPAVLANLAAAFPDASPAELAAMAGSGPATTAPSGPTPAATVAPPSAAPAVAQVSAGPVPNKGFAEPLAGGVGETPDFWMSTALVLAGVVGGMLVTTVAFLLFRTRRRPDEDDAVRRHHELLAQLAQLQRVAPRDEARPAPDAPQAPAIAPPAATLARRLGEIANGFNTVAATPELTLETYLAAFAESGTMYVAKIGPGGDVALGPEIYQGSDAVDLVAMALRDDAAALVPSFAWLTRMREGGATADRAGEQVARAFGLRADGSGRLTCPRPAMVEGGQAGLRLLPGQLSGFA